MLGFLSLKPTLYPGGAVTSRFSFSRSALAADALRAARMTAPRNNAARIFIMAYVPAPALRIVDGVKLPTHSHGNPVESVKLF
jgi:hypothetical protein